MVKRISVLMVLLFGQILKKLRMGIIGIYNLVQRYLDALNDILVLICVEHIEINLITMEWCFEFLSMR